MEDPDGDMDVDFKELNDAEPDTLDLMEDEFGAKIQLECLLHEEMQEEVRSNGKLIGKARDSFGLFRVVQISSHEHYAGEPTKLNKAEGMWKKAHDRLVYENDNPGKQRAGQQVRTNSQMAEMFGKSEREVELRRRFLKRLHRDDEGYPVTPKQLR
jgi:PAS domain-containing protein